MNVSETFKEFIKDKDNYKIVEEDGPWKNSKDLVLLYKNEPIGRLTIKNMEITVKNSVKDNYKKHGIDLKYFIDGVKIRPDQRGIKNGDRLIEYVTNNYDSVGLFVRGSNNIAKKLYEKNGFKKVYSENWASGNEVTEYMFRK